MNQVVTELVIDGRGAEVGSAAYVRAMQVAQAAVDRLRDREDALKASSEATSASMITASTSTQRAAAAYDRLKASIDPVFAASKGLERDVLTLDRAVTRLGISEQEAARMLDLVVLKHDAVAAAAKRQADAYQQAAAAAREQQAAARTQGLYNTALNVRSPDELTGAARASAAAFSAELDRLDEIAQLKARQAGENFAADLQRSLVTGVQQSARESAMVFAAELDRIDQIAALKAQQAGAYFAEDFNARMGIGRPVNSARESASVFAAAGTGRHRLSGMQVQQLGYQANDIVTMALLGAPISQIAFSQSGQVLQGLQMGEGGISGSLKAIKASAVEAGAAVAGFLGPVGLAAGGVTALGVGTYALVRYFHDTSAEAKEFQSWLDKIGSSANTTAEFLDRVGKATQGLTAVDLNKLSRQGQAYIKDQRSQLENPLAIASGFEGNLSDPGFVQTYNLIDRIIGKLRSNNGFQNIDELHRALNQVVATRPDLQRFAEQWEQLGEAILKAKEASEQAARQAELTAHGMGAYQPRDGGAVQAYLDRNADALFQLQRDRDVQFTQLYARSPAEQAAAARKAEEAKRDPTEKPEVQKYREGSAAALAYAQALKTITDAQEQRAIAYRETLTSEQLDLLLIGKTTREVTEQQQAFQMLSALRQDAAQNGITSEADFQKYYGAEIAQVMKLAAELGKLAKARAEAQLTSDLAFSRAQLFRTPLDASIASQLRGAGFPVDLNGPLAKEMRSQADIANIHDSIDSFFSTFTQEATTQGKSIGQALMDALQAGVYSELNSLIKGLTDQLTAWLTKALPDAAGLGGTGTGSAGTNIVGDTVKLLAANQNTPDMNAFAGAIKKIESGSFAGNYSALGPVTASGDRAYGAYQVMGANIGPWTKSAFGVPWTPSQFLASPAGQDAVFARQFGSYVTRFGPSGAAQAWLGGPGSVGSGGGVADMLGTTGQGYVDQFNANLKSMAGTAGMATQGLSSFGTGANQVGQSMMQAANSASSGGGDGLFGWLGKLFGFGGSSLFPAAPTGVPINSLTPADYGFAAGTPSAPPGWAWVGERGPELMNFRGGETVVPSHISMRAARGYASGTPGFGSVIAGNQNGGADVLVQINHAPPGTRTRETRSQGPNGRELRKIVVDIMDEHAADGGLDGTMAGLYGVKRNGTAR